MSLEVKKLSVTSENGHVIVKDISFSVSPGEILTLIGPSGVGKSTVLGAVSGHLTPELIAKGELTLNGQSLMRLAPAKRRIGVLFQDSILFPHLTVAGNLSFGIPQRQHRMRTQTVKNALEKAGLIGFENRDPASLSGGQAARVALMRVLLSEPRALLLDEPFSKLDQALRSEFRRFVLAQVKEVAIPAILVTHDQDDADAAGGPIVDLGRANCQDVD